MICDISYKTLGLSFSILTVGTIGGWAMVSEVAGNEAGDNFLVIGSLIQVAIFLSQLTIFFCMRNRLFLQLIFLAACGISLAWFMFSLVAPVLWMDVVSVEVKSVVLVVLILLSALNIMESFRRFDERWAGIDASIRIRRLGMAGDAVNWDGLISFMRLEADFYIPGFSKGISVATSILMLVFMLIGLNLRHVFPTFSAFAWGIPSALTVAFLFKLIGFNLAQAGKVRMLEKEYQVIFQQAI